MTQHAPIESPVDEGPFDAWLDERMRILLDAEPRLSSSQRRRRLAQALHDEMRMVLQPDAYNVATAYLRRRAPKGASRLRVLITPGLVGVLLLVLAAVLTRFHRW